MHNTQGLLTRTLLGIFALFLVQGCSKSQQAANSFSDPVLRAIAQASDERNIQALSVFLSSDNTKHQAYAAQCFGSFGDSIPVNKLAGLMLSEDSILCHNAAWAIGQKGDSTSCAILLDAWSQNPTNTTILEAIAKSMPVSSSPLNQQCHNFFAYLSLTSDALNQGFANAAFHLHYRKIFNDDLLNKLLLSQYQGQDMWVRKAQAIGRFRKKMNDAALRYIASYHSSSMAPDIELALIPSFGFLSDSLIQNRSLANIHSLATDPRVALAHTQLLIRKFPENESIWRNLYGHPSENIQKAVLEATVQAPFNSNFAKHMVEIPQSKERHPAHYAYYQMKLGAWTIDQFQQYYLDQPEGYKKIAFVPLLGTSLEGANWIYQQAFSTKHLALRYSLAEEWMRINELNHDKSNVLQWRALWDIQDIGINALMCEKLPALLNEAHDKLVWVEELSRYQQTLRLPQEVETYEAIRVCLEKLAPLNRVPYSSKSIHAIPWELIQSLPEYPVLEIKTSKGDFTVVLDLLNAPGSVSNFIALVQEGFYNKKYFHRMVPNFVIQGGCPRGDGMGSTPYTIRSEFNRDTYTTGSVGLASSGRDTESCQWFVSHLPTPHLDGRYTIIGQIEKGMDVVHSLAIGDQILAIRPLNF